LDRINETEASRQRLRFQPAEPTMLTSSIEGVGRVEAHVNAKTHRGWAGAGDNHL